MNPEKPTVSDDKQIHLDVRVKSCLFESFTIVIFNQVFTLRKANVFFKLHEFQNITSNVREKKWPS
jgi:hypothetical protein